MADNPKWSFFKDGRQYLIRFFNSRDRRDLNELVQIAENPETQKWMNSVHDMTYWNYRDWMNETGQDNTYLFAIADPHDSPEPRIHGFIYIYPSLISEGRLEISFAKQPGAPSGLITPAIETVLSYLHDYFSRKKPWLLPSMKILAEIERDNVPSIKVTEKAGFKMIRDFDEDGNAIWARKLDSVHHHHPRFENLARIRQLNGSYCGPATIEILLSHFGIQTDQETVVEAGSTKQDVLNNGMSVEMLAKAVKQISPDMSFWVKRGASLDDLTTMVREYNYPVGVDWQGIFENAEYDDLVDSPDQTEPESSPTLGDEGHYSVITDVDTRQNQVVMRNPYGHFSEKDQFQPIPTFLDRWWDDREDTLPDGTKKYVNENKLMFVIVPKTVRLPENLGMTEL